MTKKFYIFYKTMLTEIQAATVFELNCFDFEADIPQPKIVGFLPNLTLLQNCE